MIRINLGESNPLFLTSVLYPGEVPLTSDVYRIGSLNILMGGIYTSIICMNPETSTGHTLLVLRQVIIPTKQLHRNREVD